MPVALKIEQGQTFNRLKVIEEVEPRQCGNRKIRVFKCRCSCGNIDTYLLTNLRCGDSQSCGCFNVDQKTTHGLKTHPLYDVWADLNRRCYNPNAKDYKYYGGNGITVFSDWRKGDNKEDNAKNLKNFVEWAENKGYEQGLEIDRKNTQGNYHPNNCRFITHRENNLNRSNTVIIKEGKYKGKTLVALLETTGNVVPYETARHRYKNAGWSAEDAVTFPSKGNWKSAIR